MTQDEIIEMAREVYGTTATEQEIRFAKLIAAKEREACANICQDLLNRIKPIYCVSTENAMKLIKTRGQA